MLDDPNSPEAVAELPSQTNDEVRVRGNYVPIGMGLTPSFNKVLFWTRPQASCLECCRALLKHTSGMQLRRTIRQECWPWQSLQIHMQTYLAGVVVFCLASFSCCSLRSSRQRAYCSALAGLGSSSPLSQKQNQSTLPWRDIKRSHGFCNS